MTSLYQPERHLKSAPVAWNPDDVKAWLQSWATSALSLHHQLGGWPVHPRDASDFKEDESIPRLTTLYCGEAGVWLTLARLAQAGFCELPRPLTEIYIELLGIYAQTPDTGERVPSWFLGESSLLTARWLAEPDAAVENRLAEVILDNRENPTREALWGAPGTMIAALFLWEHSGSERWANLFRDSVAAIWAHWTYDEQLQVWLWQQDMYGQQTRYLGAGHGWAGNLYPLWRGYKLLTPQQQGELRERTLTGLNKLARVKNNHANWPALAPLTNRPEHMLLQWCHGAPGMITSLRHASMPEVLPLLSQGAELIYTAGPLAKGVSLCHGSDGNGYALLELFTRTQDPVWLERARHFAMWALAQSREAYARQNQWHYSLWTGDAGLACYLLDCLQGRSTGIPGLDSF